MKKKALPNDEKEFIANTFRPQLHERKTELSIDTASGKKVTVTYCVVSNNPDNDDKNEIIVLLPGFGSGWTGISMLAYHLVKLGYKVYMLSLPGYGNSPTPEEFYYFIGWSFHWHIETLSAFAKKVFLFNGKKIHWVGHSMGAAIITGFAIRHAEFVKSLTLLNPAGFKKRGQFELATKFALNGLRHGWAFHGDPLWAEISKALPKQQSPFTEERLEQRISEFKILCEDTALGYLSKVPVEIQLCYLTSTYDFVIRCDPSRFRSAHSKIVWYNLCGSFHNTTMFESDITADYIDTFIKRLT
jgi:pimeloyl-ACP methyl ester carboxylesterase